MTNSNEAAFRVRQVLWAMLVLGALTLLICGALIGWSRLPGLWGEWLGTIVGVMSTPFVLEGSFLFLGIVLVILINVLRRRRGGDDFVEMEVEESRQQDDSKGP